MVQVEGLTCVPFSQVTSQNDRMLFSTTVWDVAAPNAERVTYDGTAESTDYDLACFIERASCFYLRGLDRRVPKEHLARLNGPLHSLFGFASHVDSWFADGRHPFSKPEWETDTLEHTVTASEAFLDYTDFKMLDAIGLNVATIVLGETTALELTMKDNLLESVLRKGSWTHTIHQISC